MAPVPTPEENKQVTFTDRGVSFTFTPWHILNEPDLIKYKEFKINLFKIRLFEFFMYKDKGWFKLFGYGITWRNINSFSLMFSERYGYTKYLRIGKWIIKFTKR